MNTMTCKILTASIVLALSCGLGAEAKGSQTKIMTDPSITQKAIEAQMNQTVANKDVNFNNMLLQKNLASSITEAAATSAMLSPSRMMGARTPRTTVPIVLILISFLFYSQRTRRSCKVIQFSIIITV